MLINLSNHPSFAWSEEQIASANEQFGEVVDLQFPAVDPGGDEIYIKELAEEYCEKCLEIGRHQDFVVHLMGEMTLTFAMLKRLQAKNLIVIASTTERVVTEYGKKKIVEFKFVKFRKYL